MSGSPSATGTRTIRIWDVWIRLFHWSLVLAIAFLVYSGRTGELFTEWHRRVGELVLVLVVFRLLWGVFGSSNARLASLIVDPRAALAHLRDLAARRVHRETRHNAAGGWAVLALLVLLGVQAVTGLFIADEDEIVEGALYGAFGSDTSDWLHHVHHVNADLLQVLVVVHIVMIAVYLLHARLNLVTPMVTGRARVTAERAPDEPSWRPVGVGAVCAAVALAGVGRLCGWF